MKNESIRKSINVDKPNYSPVWNFKQEDDGVLKLALFKGSTLLDITGQTIKLGAKRPNNSIVELTDGFKINKNELDITLKNNILAVPGIVECDLEIIDASGKMTTASFYLSVSQKMTGENNLNASNDISAINKLVEDIKKKGKDIDTVINDVKPKSDKLMSDIKKDYDSLHKIIIDENQAANLQDQVNKTNAQLETITTVAVPKMFLSDSDNDKIQKALDYVRDNSNVNEIKLECNKVYNINNGLTFTGDYLKIDGNGSTLNLTTDNITVLKVSCEHVIIENLTIDGSSTTQDKFDITDYNLLNRIEAIFLTANNIEFKNVTIKNFYGSAFINIGCKNFIAENISISNVGGHWYQNNNYDAFGDAFYFRELDKEANIIMNNIDVIMKNKDITQSRAGVVLERNNDDISTNTTNLILSNVNFINCDRCIHIENQAREVNIDITNGKFYGNVFGIGWNSNSINYTARESKFTLADGSYGGTIGFSKLKLISDNCIFNLKDVTNCFLRECNGSVVSKSVLNNIGKVINLSSNVKYYDTILNIVNNGYLSYNSNVEYNRCVFNSESLITENKTGQKINEYVNCTINNYIPIIKNAINTSIYVDDSYDINVMDFNNLDVKIYKNNILNYSPRTFKVFPYSKDFDLSVFYKTRDFPDTSTYLSIIPDNFVSQKLSKYLIIFIGHNSSGGLIDFDYSQFYYAVITTDNSNNKNVSKIKTYGTITGTRMLEINDSDKTVKQVGQYANKLQSVIVPYFWKEYLPISTALEL